MLIYFTTTVKIATELILEFSIFSGIKNYLLPFQTHVRMLEQLAWSHQACLSTLRQTILHSNTHARKLINDVSHCLLIGKGEHDRS